MKPTDFAKHLPNFFLITYQHRKMLAEILFYSYRDTFKLLIKYCQEIKKMPAEKITLSFFRVNV